MNIDRWEWLVQSIHTYCFLPILGVLSLFMIYTPIFGGVIVYQATWVDIFYVFTHKQACCYDAALGHVAATLNSNVYIMFYWYCCMFYV